MPTFIESAQSLLDGWDNDEWRQRQFSAFVSGGLPRTEDEIWRYAPLSSFELDSYSARANPSGSFDAPIAAYIADAKTVIRVLDGAIGDVDVNDAGVRVSSVPPSEAPGWDAYDSRYGGDPFALLSASLTPSTVVIAVDPGIVVDVPIVIVHQVKASAAFPTTRIELGARAKVDVIEYFLGGEDALVASVSEFHVGEGANLRLSTIQRFASSTWHVTRTTAFLSRDAKVRQASVGLGAKYNRSRNDAQLLESGASNELHTTFLGAGEQVHDLRTHQFHLGARTTSTLLSKGAVAGNARSVYTGLIEIEKGAKRTDARQKNFNLLLSPTSHADTVPNLDIRENDVLCAHASTVGPLDELQRWYLESRGVERPEAERLMVRGFFNEMTVAMPKVFTDLVDEDVTRILASSDVVIG